MISKMNINDSIVRSDDNKRTFNRIYFKEQLKTSNDIEAIKTRYSYNNYLLYTINNNLLILDEVIDADFVDIKE